MIAEQMADDPEFKDFFINLVTQELTIAKVELQNIIAGYDSSTAKGFLHKLKGTSGTSGLLKLTQNAAYWEVQVDANPDLYKMQQEVTNEISKGIEIPTNGKKIEIC